MAGTQIVTTDDMSTSFPFNAEGDPLTGYDRIWDAADFAEYFALFIGNGIYPNPSTSLQVTSKYGNMVVTLQKGTAFINGYGFILKEDIDITLEKAHSANRRIDTINIRWDVIERKIYPVYKIGDPAASPKALPIIRNADCYELYLANIEVPAGATSITKANIKDLRDEKEVCGKVLILGTELDTTTIYEQYEAYLYEKVIEWESYLTEKKSEWTKIQQEQEQLWLTQTDTQQINWQNQTDAQKRDYITWRDTIDHWKSLTIAELGTVITFAFDNQFAYPGTVKDTVLIKNGAKIKTVAEVLKWRNLNKVFAEQTTTFLENGNIETIETVYNIDDSIFRSVKATVVLGDTIRTEVVNL